MSKDDMISYLAVLIIVVSLASIGMRLTGYANVTDTARVNVTIDTSAALLFTVDYLDFGNGTVTSPASGAYLYTNGTNPIDGSWPTGVTDNLTLENVGNVNLELEFYADDNASTFLGGTNPEFKYMLTEDESGSCSTGAVDLVDGSTFRDMNTTNFTVCSNFTFDDGHDQIAVDVMLYIPGDSFIGERITDITAVGFYTP